MSAPVRRSVMWSPSGEEPGACVAPRLVAPIHTKGGRRSQWHPGRFPRRATTEPFSGFTSSSGDPVGPPDPCTTMVSTAGRAESRRGGFGLGKGGRREMEGPAEHLALGRHLPFRPAETKEAIARELVRSISVMAMRVLGADPGSHRDELPLGSDLLVIERPCTDWRSSETTNPPLGDSGRKIPPAVAMQSKPAGPNLYPNGEGGRSS